MCFLKFTNDYFFSLLIILFSVCQINISILQGELASSTRNKQCEAHNPHQTTKLSDHWWRKSATRSRSLPLSRTASSTSAKTTGGLCVQRRYDLSTLFFFYLRQISFRPYGTPAKERVCWQRGVHTMCESFPYYGHDGLNPQPTQSPPFWDLSREHICSVALRQQHMMFFFMNYSS